jgi:two-component system alkaline phosphatase synthesis response regulator PhoP
MKKQLLFIVEDDASIRDLVSYALTCEGYEVRAFESAESALCAFKERIPKLILLDIMLPEMDGIGMLEYIRSEYKNLNIKVIMLTAKNSEINKIGGLNSGADDYVTKPFSVLELIARVKANLRKYAVEISEEILSFKDLKISIAGREVFIGENKINLTYKEFELLKILMENLNNVVEREKLLERIWGYEYFGQTRTLDIHINTLREKLGEYGDCVVTARGVGFMFKGAGV